MDTAIVLASGGIKSGTAAARIGRERELILLHIDYGQRSARNEIEAVRDQARAWSQSRVLAIKVPLIEVLEHPFSKPEAAPMADAAAPSAAALLAERGILASLLAIGLQTALRLGATSVVTGVSRRAELEHLGFVGGDLRSDQFREVIHGINIVANAYRTTRQAVQFDAPLMNMRYDEIIQLGDRLELRFDRTWTCQQRGRQPCGECLRCREREIGFREAGRRDPLATGATASRA